MKIYSFKRLQVLPMSLREAWDFFSSPQNLGLITPNHMGFDILYQSGTEKMYAGKIIRYRIEIFPHISIQWITEITHVKEPDFFVDEQRYGPYAMWHHQHHFRELASGVEMIDEINYAVPFGLIGRFAHHIFVERQVSAIFDYRAKALTEYFVGDGRKKEL